MTNIMMPILNIGLEIGQEKMKDKHCEKRTPESRAQNFRVGTVCNVFTHTGRILKNSIPKGIMFLTAFIILIILVMLTF